AGGDRLDAVLGLAAAERPQRRPEADEEPARLHPEPLRREEVAELVQHHRHEQRDDEEEHPERVHQALTSSAARVRAHCSASSTAARSGSGTTSCSSTTRATVSTIAGNRTRPARNAATSSSLAALRTAGAVPPRRPASRHRSTAGNALASSGKNSH